MCIYSLYIHHYISLNVLCYCVKNVARKKYGACPQYNIN